MKPPTIFLMSNQGTNADDRVVDVLGELVTHGSPNFIIALAVMTIGGSKALDVGDRFDIPNDDAAHDSNIQQAGWPKVHPCAVTWTRFGQSHFEVAVGAT
jgi:hypothetical protein